MSDSPPAFCSNCGAPLVSGNAFCDQCGHRTAPAQPATPSQEVPPIPSQSPPPSPTSAASFQGAERVNQSSNGVPLMIIIMVAAILGGFGGLVVERYKKEKSGKTLPVPTSVKPTILADPVGAFNDRGTPPVEIAYVHFMNEAYRLTNGQIQVGSPSSTPTRIEVRVTAASGKPEIVVVLEKSNDGRNAVVLVGPKDAGAVRSYTLALGPDGWKIEAYEDLNG